MKKDKNTTNDHQPLLNVPQQLTKYDRNYRLYERLLNEGLYVLPILTEDSKPECRFIDYIVVAVQKPRAYKNSQG
jgi:hypothetical protein